MKKLLLLLILTFAIIAHSRVEKNHDLRDYDDLNYAFVADFYKKTMNNKPLSLSANNILNISSQSGPL